MNVAVIGQGYVGLTIAIGAANAGHEVIGIDLNLALVKNLNSGHSHIEGITGQSILQVIQSGRYRASSKFEELNEAEIVVIAVPTPIDSNGKPDISMLESAVNSISKYVKNGALIINESTSYIGTLRNLIAATVKVANPDISDFAVSPERVDPGNEKFNLRNTPRIVGGINSISTKRAMNFYSTFCDTVVEVDTPEIAEAAKLLENSFRYVNIGFINEFTQVLTAMNISPTEVINAASTKPYGFMTFFPNIGVGGHCIPVDPHYFQKNSHDVHLESRFISLSERLNREMPSYTIQRLETHFGNLQGKHVLVIGVSYKPDVSDTRESPAEAVIEVLRGKGAKVSWHDPLVEQFLRERTSPVHGEYDLALVLVKHKVLDLSTWTGKPIYCINPTPSEPNWIPLFGPQNRK